VTDPTPSSVGSPPPFDEECAVVVAAMPAAQPLTAERILLLREAAADWTPRPDDAELARGGEYLVEEHSAPGAAGAPDVALLVCRPARTTGPVPALYAVHGGGMIMGTARDRLSEVLDLAAHVGAVLVSVEYRLAPETPHPGPVEDVYAGLVWTAEHAADLGIDPERIVLLGTSAGGGLAAAAALLARDRSGPPLAGQLLQCPMLDDRNESPSSHQMAEAPIWTRQENEAGWTALLGEERGGPHVSPYAAPARATDLSGLPPTFVDVGSAELFRDEDVAYASRIWQAGGIAELHVWPGGFHGSDGIVPQAGISKAAVAARADWLRRVLAS
jgi:acetyl esterase/lipase